MVNKCTFIGNVGRQPEVTYLQNGTCVAKFSIGCNEVWYDKNTNEKKENTEWVRFVAFGKQAETIGKHVVAGQQLYIESKVKTSKYEKDNETRYSTEFQVIIFKFLGNKSNNSQPNHQGQPQNSGYQSNNGQGNYQQPNQPQGQPSFQGQNYNQGRNDSFGGQEQGFNPPPDDD